jgi:hypothetical protein
MALNGSGPISIAGTTAGQSIQIELNGNGTTTMSLNDASVRTLAGPAFTTPATTIQMPTNFYGKSNRVTLSVTYSASATDVTLALGSISGYAAGTSDITVTINSGVYLYSTSTGNSGLTITGGTSGDTLTIVNNGFILGRGGNGGGAVGGPALSLSYPATINNTNPAAYVAGGGGGGGSAGGGGGGAGGGTGGSPAGGAGGGIGASGSPGGGNASGGGGGGSGGAGGGQVQGPPKGSPTLGGGGGGGRILPGTGGTGIEGGQGRGGNGGPANNAGSNGTNGGGGGGGGWGASGGAAGPGAGGGGGGKAVTLNGNTVTWTSGNTTRVYGAVS